MTAVPGFDHTSGVPTTPSSSPRSASRLTTLAASTVLALLAALLPAPASAGAARAEAAVAASPTARAGVSTLTTGLSAEDRLVARRLWSRIDADPYLRGHVAGLVRDAGTGERVWSRTARVGRLPASTTKVATAVAALHALGPDTRLVTRVYHSPNRTRVVLVAAGDPELRRAHLALLAERTARSLRARGVPAVSIRVDDSIFAPPTLAPGWKWSYLPGDVAPVRGLMVDQREVADTAIDAGRRFGAELEARGIRVAGTYRERGAERGSALGWVQGWTVRSMVARMLNVSDNDTAEYLARLVALATGLEADWSGARWGVRRALLRSGADVTGINLYDGSGLSRSNRVTPQAMVGLLRTVESRPDLRGVLYSAGALPVAGTSGTLDDSYGRYVTWPTRCARGDVVAKTGTLDGAVTLAGRTVGADGRPKLFSFVVYDRPTRLAVRRAVDKLATTVHGCW